MKVSIIIPTLNEVVHIENTLNMWLAQSFDDFEIIVVDGGSSDLTQQIVKKYSELDSNVRLVVAEGSGPAEARNIGCKEANGDILFLIDADIESVNKEFVENVMVHFEDENVVGVYPKLVITEHTLIESTFKYRSESNEKKEWDIHPPILRKNIYSELRGMPINLGFGEDRFFSEKLFHYVMNTSNKLVNEDCAILRVHRVHTLKEYYKQQLWYGRTYPLFANISGYGAVKYLSFYANTFFISLCIFVIFIPKYPIFFINLLPIIGGACFFIAKGIKRQKLVINITLYSLYLVGGVAKGIGLLLYLSGKRSPMSK